MTTGTETEYTCGKLPAPWRCSLKYEHEGPCSATRDPKVSEKTVVHDFPKDCPHSDPQPAFYLSKEQREVAVKWMHDHDAERHIPPGKKFRYSGAIGGAYTWCYTGTSIGVVITVECACGEKFDVSDYNLW